MVSVSFPLLVKDYSEIIQAEAELKIAKIKVDYCIVLQKILAEKILENV
jgi:hypothetical protein